ncbi:MAG: hypothetical protein ACKV2T_37070 [Kofleriaceae bacterium]
MVNTLGTWASTAGGLVGDYASMMNNDLFSGVGDMASGVGKLASYKDNGEWDPNWGGVGDLVNGAISLADADSGASSGGIGALIGGGSQAVFNGIEAHENWELLKRESDPAARADIEHNLWGASGDATLGALHAGLGSWCAPADAAITGTETILDTLGTVVGVLGGSDAAFGAGDVVGGVLDAVIPEEEDAWSNSVRRFGRSLESDPDDAYVTGELFGLVADAGMAPFRLANAASSAFVNTIGNVCDSDRDTRNEYLDVNQMMTDEVSAAARGGLSFGSRMADVIVPATPQQALARHALFAGAF